MQPTWHGKLRCSQLSSQCAAKAWPAGVPGIDAMRCSKLTILTLRLTRAKNDVGVYFVSFIIIIVFKDSPTEEPWLRGSPSKDWMKVIASRERIHQIVWEVTRLWMCVHAIRRLRKGRAECSSFFSFFPRAKKLRAALARQLHTNLTTVCLVQTTSC